MKKKSAGSVAIMLLVMIYLLIPLVISIIYSISGQGLFLKDLPFTTMWTCLWTAISLHLLDDLSQ